MNLTHKDVSATPTFVFGHGAGGLFSGAGLERALFSAMALPVLGLQRVLPVRSSTSTNPLIGIMTGVTAPTGSAPVGVCDDAPTVGTMKLCTQSHPFGRQGLATRVMNVDRVGATTNRGESTDLQLFGGGLSAMQGVPTIPAGNPAQNEAAKALYEMGVTWLRTFAREMYTGNPVNNTAGGGRTYFYGLETLINTGYRDAETGVACPAADSLVLTANASIKGSAVVEDAMVQRFTAMYRALNRRASQFGLTPVQWAIAMPHLMFYELSDVWPIAHSTYRASGNVEIASGEANALRDEMRGDLYNSVGQFLLIDGQRVPVIIDDAITVTETAGVFSASAFFIPLTVLGRTPSTMIEYFDFDVNGGAMDAARAFAPSGNFYTTDNGRFLWTVKPPHNWCVQVEALTRPRLLLLTPQIAGRIDGVQYTTLIADRGWDTSDSTYFVNGGSTTGQTPTFYSPTA